MSKPYLLTREEIAKAFPSPRAMRRFELLQESVAKSEEAVDSGVAATDTLANATFVTLSPNTELQGERVLRLGSGLGFDLTVGGAVTIRLTNAVPRVPSGFLVQFAASGDTLLGLPLAGFLATREAVSPSVKAVSASYAEDIAYGDLIVKVTATGQTVTLPAAGASHARITVKLMVAGTVTVDGAGAETIDGAASVTISTQYQAITLVSDGAGWLAV